MFRLLFGIVIGVALVPAAAYWWLTQGHPPVAVADPAIPYEQQIVGLPLHARIEKEMPQSAPIQTSEDNYMAGAEIYKEQCAECHGFHGKPAEIAGHMFPRAPQLWQVHRDGKTVGVSDDPPGETYWKVANGIRLSGMPAYDKILTQTQMWQVTLLVANADKPLPPAVVDIVDGKSAPAPAAPMKPAGK